MCGNNERASKRAFQQTAEKFIQIHDVKQHVGGEVLAKHY